MWFWTFWQWSRESHRARATLLNPVQGVASHWDEWYRNEASENDRRQIEALSLDERKQRQFIAWLLRRWSRDVDWSGNRAVCRFVLSQLARVPPFDNWTSIARYRASYGRRGVAAVILRRPDVGEADDVRPMEAIVLPRSQISESPVVAEGFKVSTEELVGPRSAALALLRGRGLLLFLGLWIAAGRRPESRGAQMALAAGWLTLTAVMAALAFAPGVEPLIGTLAASLLGLWALLVFRAVVTLVWTCFRAWRASRVWADRLEQGQLRFRMNGNLTLYGQSAGLPFCLNALLAVARCYPDPGRRSWLWQQCFTTAALRAHRWAATGAVRSDGRLRPVVMTPKLQASLAHPGINDLLTPPQREAGDAAVAHLIENESPVPSSVATQGITPGFAANRAHLRCHRSWHVAQSLIQFGGMISPRQAVANGCALVVSAFLIAALPGLRQILLPPPAPMAIASTGAPATHLRVELATHDPEAFSVSLESNYWANRRLALQPIPDRPGAGRVDFFMNRLSRPTTRDEQDGVIWIERRLQLFGRQFAPGERVGRYTISYLNQLHHE